MLIQVKEKKNQLVLEGTKRNLIGTEGQEMKYNGATWGFELEKSVLKAN